MSVINPITLVYQHANIHNYPIKFNKETYNLTVGDMSYTPPFSPLNSTSSSTTSSPTQSPLHSEEFPSLSSLSSLTSISSISTNNNFPIMDEKEIKQQVFKDFLDLYPHILEEHLYYESLPIEDYSTWGETHYNPNIEYNNIDAYYQYLVNQPSLLLDTEGFPKIGMLQLGTIYDPKIYVYTNRKVIEDCLYYLLPNQNIQKIVWCLREEEKRAQYANTTIINCLDLQTYFSGLGLKRVLGQFYNVRLEVLNRKEFYTQNWTKPNRKQIVYGSLDIIAMKECIKKCFQDGTLHEGLFGALY